MNSPIPKADSFRALGLVTVPVGGARELVFSETTGETRILSSNDVDILFSCRHFDTLESHAAAICSQMGLPPGYGPALVEILSRLRSDGLLVSRNWILSRCRPDPEVPPISTLGVVTKDRPELLERCLRGYIANTRTHHRKVTFLVTDDSTSPAGADRNRRMLEGLRSELGAHLMYAGQAEKAAYLEALVREGSADRDLIEFALFDPEGIGHTPGANRNALLLASLGELLVSVDDDTECRISAIPGARPDVLTLSSSTDPTETWAFPDRAGAIRAASFSEQDYLGLHASVLGRKVGDSVARFPNSEMDRMDARMMRELCSETARVRMSQIGLIGDCALGTSLSVLLWEGRSRDRLLLSEKEFRTAVTSREVIRGASTTTISSNGMFMTYGAGFDHRSWLPPFFPVLRFQDGLFSITMKKCFGQSLVGHLPWAVLHAPQGHREYLEEDVWKEAGSVFLGDYVMHGLESLEVANVYRDPEKRLQALGRHLQELAALPLPDFEDFFRRRIWREGVAWIDQLGSQADEFESVAPYWSEAVRRSVAEHREALRQPGLLTPVDISVNRSDDEALAMARRLLHLFGRLLVSWSAIREAAVALRDRGITLARPIERKA